MGFCWVPKHWYRWSNASALCDSLNEDIPPMVQGVLYRHGDAGGVLKIACALQQAENVDASAAAAACST